MRKCVSIPLTIIFVLSGVSFLRCELSANGSPQVIRVPSTDFATIQEAINNASSGDTILIAPGTYEEHLTIDRSLSLVGENRDTTIVDGLDAESVISITSDNVIIEGLTIMKSVSRPYDTGIAVESQRGIVVNNTRITGASTGIVLATCTVCIFSGNIVVNNTNGITLLFSNSNVFSNNVVSGNSEGIYLYNSNNNVFFGNTLSDNGEGASINSGRANYFYHNNFVDAVTLFGISINLWSRGGEGNYWASYNFTENDADDDGIGDAPFYIDDNNEDDYPLMGVFYDFAVPFKSEMYHIDVVSNSTITDFRFETGRETGNRMVTFTTSGDNSTAGFCRIMIPTLLMDYPFIVVDRNGEANASLLSASNNTNAYLYFTYLQEDQSIAVISSRTLQLYNELLDNYTKLQAQLQDLNNTYQGLLTSYNATLQAMLNSFSLLLDNFTELQNSYLDLNSSLHKNLIDQSDSTQNIRNLAYVFAATTAAFLTTTAYLSARVHARGKPKTRVAEERE